MKKTFRPFPLPVEDSTMDVTDCSGESLLFYRDLFPVTKNFVYFDHAGVSPVSLRVKEAIEKFLEDVCQSGGFRYGFWMEGVRKARSDCARLINADPEEVAFIRSTSHGLSLVAQGIEWKRGDNVLVYAKDFPANIYPWLALGEKGVEVRYISSPSGKIAIEDIERLVNVKTKLLTVSSVQYSNGFRIDLKKVGEFCRAKGILFCVDAIQSLGVIPMDVKDFDIDFLAADGHKWLLGPEGAGIFYCRETLIGKLLPSLVGWRSVANEYDFDVIDFRLKDNAQRFEEGSMNTMGVVGLGAAVELFFEVGIERIEKRVLDLGDLIIGTAEARGLTVKSPKAREERGGIVSVTGAFDLLAVKDKLRDLGIVINVRDNALRLSPHFYNTENEVARFFEALDKVK